MPQNPPAGASPALTLSLLPDLYCCLRLEPSAPVPPWAQYGPFSSITRTADELSIFCRHTSVPALLPDGIRIETGFRLLRVRGPLPFSLTGIIASIAVPLAAAGVSLAPIATFDTDYILIQNRDLAAAVASLTGAGHRVEQ